MEVRKEKPMSKDLWCGLGRTSSIWFVAGFFIRYLPDNLLFSRNKPSHISWYSNVAFKLWKLWLPSLLSSCILRNWRSSLMAYHCLHTHLHRIRSSTVNQLNISNSISRGTKSPLSESKTIFLLFVRIKFWRNNFNWVIIFPIFSLMSQNEAPCIWERMNNYVLVMQFSRNPIHMFGICHICMILIFNTNSFCQKKKDYKRKLRLNLIWSLPHRLVHCFQKQRITNIITENLSRLFFFFWITYTHSVPQKSLIYIKNKSTLIFMIVSIELYNVFKFNNIIERSYTVVLTIVAPRQA